MRMNHDESVVSGDAEIRQPIPSGRISRWITIIYVAATDGVMRDSTQNSLLIRCSISPA